MPSEGSSFKLSKVPGHHLSDLHCYPVAIADGRTTCAPAIHPTHLMKSKPMLAR